MTSLLKKYFYFFNDEKLTLIRKIWYAVFAYRNSLNEIFVKAVKSRYLLKTSFKAFAGKNFTFCEAAI